MRQLVSTALAAMFGVVAGAVTVLSYIGDIGAGHDSILQKSHTLVTDGEGGFEIIDRDVVPFGVPVFRSGAKYGENVPTALDVMPRGKPADFGRNGVAWVDVCNADLLDDPTEKVECLRLGVDKAGDVFVGSKAFNRGAGGQIHLLVNGVTRGILGEGGLEIFGKVKATSFEEEASFASGVSNTTGNSK